MELGKMMDESEEQFENAYLPIVTMESGKIMDDKGGTRLIGHFSKLCRTLPRPKQNPTTFRRSLIHHDTALILL